MKNENESENISSKEILDYTVNEILEYINNVSIEDISFIMEAHKMNIDLFYLSLESKRTDIAKKLLKMNMLRYK